MHTKATQATESTERLLTKTTQTSLLPPSKASMAGSCRYQNMSPFCWYAPSTASETHPFSCCADQRREALLGQPSTLRTGRQLRQDVSPGRVPSSGAEWVVQGLLLGHRGPCPDAHGRPDLRHDLFVQPCTQLFPSVGTMFTPLTQGSTGAQKLGRQHPAHRGHLH